MLGNSASDYEMRTVDDQVGFRDGFRCGMVWLDDERGRREQNGEGEENTHSSSNTVDDAIYAARLATLQSPTCVSANQLIATPST